MAEEVNWLASELLKLGIEPSQAEKWTLAEVNTRKTN